MVYHTVLETTGVPVTGGPPIYFINWTLSLVSIDTQIQNFKPIQHNDLFGQGKCPPLDWHSLCFEIHFQLGVSCTTPVQFKSMFCGQIRFMRFIIKVTLICKEQMKQVRGQPLIKSKVKLALLQCHPLIERASRNLTYETPQRMQIITPDSSP